ncbi:hypothetical protein [uncultured Aquimonas sp.]|uniref:hypothetical protein n=1 Tax=uncultured Aquimonas sp. TaxID=385483 RepID=UPI0026154DCF|nr:hypothetical protein [uncultured Aquimonas sp.]
MDILLLELCLREELARTQISHRIDPFSREFVFGNSPEYTKARNRPVILGRNGRMTLLQAMLGICLNDEARRKLFPSYFHLGCPKPIPRDRQTLVELAKHVRRERGRPDDPETRKKEFESITSALKEITGVRPAEYEDRQNALRVIYLIDRMMPGSGFPEERRQRLLTFIKAPSKRFSFEARDGYPTRESEGNTFLLSDLKAYTSIEIDDDIQMEIDSIFGSLISRADDMRSLLDGIAHSSGQRTEVARAYQSIVGSLEAFDASTLVATRGRASRLDVDLYLHLNRFEFLHFAGAHAEALNVARPPSSIVPVLDEMIESFSAITGGIGDYYQTTQQKFLLEEFRALAKQHSVIFLDLIEKSLGFRPSKSIYEKSVSLAEELLRRTCAFGAGVRPGKAATISFRNIVSAICATSQSIKFPTRYRPHLFGDDSQTRSIITPLETSIKFDGSERSSDIPEGYLQIWHNRREWVQGALEGSYEIIELMFTVRSLFWSKVIACVQPNDIGVIEENLSKLESHVRGVRRGPTNT